MADDPAPKREIRIPLRIPEEIRLDPDAIRRAGRQAAIGAWWVILVSTAAFALLLFGASRAHVPNLGPSFLLLLGLVAAIAVVALWLKPTERR